MTDKILKVKRAIYGKATTPVEDREYKNVEMLGGAVGNRADWLEIAGKYGYQAVEFVELDGKTELRLVQK